MCIIAIKPKNKEMFPRDKIETMFTNNPDGAGVMYYDITKKKVIIQKGFMKVEDLCDFLYKKDFYKVPVVIHFRISTSGKINQLNCHPFPVYKQNKLYAEASLAMCHNGVLKDYLPPKGAAYNDTLLFIWRFVKKLPRNFIDSEKYLRYIQRVIGNANKLCFLDDRGRVAMIGKFEKDNGYYYSNETYKYIIKYDYLDYFNNKSLWEYKKRWY